MLCLFPHISSIWMIYSLKECQCSHEKLLLWRFLILTVDGGSDHFPRDVEMTNVYSGKCMGMDLE